MEKGLRKGQWSKQEDAVLIKYVERYGAQNWNALQRLTGLPRDGKSCRLRWLNHLNPILKKGKLSEQEKQKIVQLRQLGIKWSIIAEQIPGRTDNEIKNFYNINERKKSKMENGNGECQKKKKKINVASTSNMLSNNVASTSTKNTSSTTIIDRCEVPFMPTNMVSNVPLFLEVQSFESPLHPHSSISAKPSPTFIDRNETSFISKDMESNLPLRLPESMNFESFESLIQKYPPLPLRSSEEIQQEQLELDSPFNNNFLKLNSPFNTSNSLDDSNGNLYSCETRLVDENGMNPTSLKKDESSNEDLIDILDSLGWFDGYIF